MGSRREKVKEERELTTERGLGARWILRGRKRPAQEDEHGSDSLMANARSLQIAAAVPAVGGSEFAHPSFDVTDHCRSGVQSPGMSDCSGGDFPGVALAEPRRRGGGDSEDRGVSR